MATRAAEPVAAPVAAPAGPLSLTDGHATINFTLPDGFSESEPSSANHRTLKNKETTTTLTLLPADQPSDAGSAAAFVQGTAQTLRQAKGEALLIAPRVEQDPQFTLVMRYRVRQSPDSVLDTTTRWRKVGPLVVQSVTTVSSQDEETIKAVNDSVAAMLVAAVAPGYESVPVGPDGSPQAPPAAPEVSLQRQRFAGNTIEFSVPLNFEQISTSKSDTTRDYLSSDHVVNLVLSVLPAGTILEPRSGPVLLASAKRELAAGVNKPTAAPELLADAAVPVAIRWSSLRDGKPAQGFRLFRKVGKQVVRAEVTTTGDADAARQVGEQTLNGMTSLVPDQPAVASGALSAKPVRQLTGPAAERLNQRAQAALDQAKKLAGEGKDEDAYTKYRMIATEYAASSVASEAKDAVAKYEADPAFMEKRKKPTEAGPAEKAASMLALADNYATAGKTDEARTKYQQVIKDYADTPSATKAKKRLAELDKPPAKKP